MTDAEHIAAFDPTTALTLIARLRGAEAAIDAIDAIEPMCQDCWRYPVREGEMLCPACAANRENGSES